MTRYSKGEVGVDKRVLVSWRPREKWKPLRLNSGHRAHMSQIILGCITDEGMGAITISNGNINAAKYIYIIMIKETKQSIR